MSVYSTFDRHMIISKKKTGFISGIQRTKDGDVEWERELPPTCNLSRCVVDDSGDAFVLKILAYGSACCNC